MKFSEEKGLKRQTRLDEWLHLLIMFVVTAGVFYGLFDAASKVPV